MNDERVKRIDNTIALAKDFVENAEMGNIPVDRLQSVVDAFDDVLNEIEKSKFFA